MVSLAMTAAAQDLRVEVDHTFLLRLDTDADLVYIANPQIADISVESPRMLFLIGLSPGQTGIYILDRDGNELIVGDVIVTPNENHEVTLNRNVSELTFSCAPRCVLIGEQGQTLSGVPDLSGVGGSADEDSPDLSALGLE